MAVLVVGARGMLGAHLVQTLTGRGVEVLGLARPQIEVTDADSVRTALSGLAGVSAIVNATAWTAVDDAESNEAAAFEVNATGAANLARAAHDLGAPLLHVSTDYVFDGEADAPYAEDAVTGPRSAYGRTKLAGEWAVRALCPDSYVVRTAWLYGPHGANMARTVMRLAQSHETLSFVDDQRGQPTSTADVARYLADLIAVRPEPGIYHATNKGETTWFGFAQEIFRLQGLDPQRVTPTTTDKFPRPAPRPAYSVLGHGATARAGLEPMPHWRDALAAAIATL